VGKHQHGGLHEADAVANCCGNYDNLPRDSVMGGGLAIAVARCTLGNCTLVTAPALRGIYCPPSAAVSMHLPNLCRSSLTASLQFVIGRPDTP